MDKDGLLEAFLSDDERYADLVNGIIFEGEQKVREEDLIREDTRTGMWRLPEDGKGRGKRRTKNRDLLRRILFGVNFAVIGVENQETVDYAVPLRSLSYDVYEYERQAAEIRRRVRKSRNGEGTGSGGEYLYGFLKSSRLKPVVTLILYYGKEAWDGPAQLHEMLDFTGIPEELKAWVQDYRIHLIDIGRWEGTQVFQTDVKQVFDFIRFRRDKKKLKELVLGDPAYREMAEEAYDVMAAYTGAEELMELKNSYKKGGKVDMCEALTEMLEDERILGMEQGMERGITRGEERFGLLAERLMEEGRTEELLQASKNRSCREKLYRELGI